MDSCVGHGMEATTGGAGGVGEMSVVPRMMGIWAAPEEQRVCGHHGTLISVRSHAGFVLAKGS